MAFRADETWSHDSTLNHSVMEMLMEELDERAGNGNDAACQIEELLLGAFQAVSEGDDETAEKLVKEAVEVITYY